MDQILYLLMGLMLVILIVPTSLVGLALGLERILDR